MHRYPRKLRHLVEAHIETQKADIEKMKRQVNDYRREIKRLQYDARTKDDEIGDLRLHRYNLSESLKKMMSERDDLRESLRRRDRNFNMLRQKLNEQLELQNRMTEMMEKYKVSAKEAAEELTQMYEENERLKSEVRGNTNNP